VLPSGFLKFLIADILTGKFICWILALDLTIFCILCVILDDLIVQFKLTSHKHKQFLKCSILGSHCSFINESHSSIERTSYELDGV